MKHYEDIIRDLSECVTACEICSTSCLEEKNIKEFIDCIKLARNCADICGLGVHLLSRDSDLSDSFIGLCVDICSKCAEECEKHEHEHCKRCAEICRSCEELCKTYLDNVRQMALNT